ncbi:hypothetical protein M422DRAFT_265826 [Sphaerobolus stellatus SS14]|uniref:Uncharacterized protein n=1 Tax=Sphaerobolus stellatus (strain SS14) TaxID=990650 RepID=A0A0C9TQE1_SPHS4|nr:hypothetical protein M422DRAFT_265826 [Sphaerobolus stellatus SS14]
MDVDHHRVLHALFLSTQPQLLPGPPYICASECLYYHQTTSFALAFSPTSHLRSVHPSQGVPYYEEILSVLESAVINIEFEEKLLWYGDDPDETRAEYLLAEIWSANRRIGQEESVVSRSTTIETRETLDVKTSVLDVEKASPILVCYLVLNLGDDEKDFKRNTVPNLNLIGQYRLSSVKMSDASK